MRAKQRTGWKEQLLHTNDVSHDPDPMLLILILILMISHDSDPIALMTSHDPDPDPAEKLALTLQTSNWHPANDNPGHKHSTSPMSLSIKLCCTKHRKTTQSPGIPSGIPTKVAISTAQHGLLCVGVILMQVG